MWTRLDEMYGFGRQLWGEDLETEVGRALLSFRAARLGGRNGWQVRVHEIDDEALNEIPVTEQWSPAFVGEEEFVLLMKLCNGGEVRGDDPETLSWLESRGIEYDDVRDCLLQTHLVALSGQHLGLITKECALVILPTGEYVAAENSTGRLDRWIARWWELRERASDQ
ncbi:hypothetical protein GXW82_33800 [Streptacidiphilus sp. 4-A2]|nr:hypothetical protein [Streptacidiphilus sp. 4-A2]